MRFFDYIRISFKNIWRQKVRSFLTIIAIVIGALAVISVLSIIFGAKEVLMQELASEGMFTQIWVTSSQGNMGGKGPLDGEQEVSADQKKIDDATVADFKKLNHVSDVSPAIRIWNFETVRSKDGGGKRIKADVEAYEPGKGMDKEMVAGRNLKGDDARVLLVSSDVAKSFGYENPEDAIGKKVIFTTKKGYQGDGAQVPIPGSDKNEWEKMKEKSVDIEAEIVGITPPPGPGSNGSMFISMAWGKKICSWSNWEWDETKAKEYEQRMKSSGASKWDTKDCQECQVLKTESEIDRQGYSMAYIEVDDSKNTQAVAEEVKKKGFGAMTANDMIQMFTRIAYIVAGVMAAIGAISLGVATIGIINTMVMATMERTREIGVMRACGATRKTIRRLFMFEAATLGFLGGLLGVVSGIGISKIANYFINRALAGQKMAATNIISLPWWLILAAIGITTLLGILSGFYPAHRAAKLDPVEALRYE